MKVSLKSNDFKGLFYSVESLLSQIDLDSRHMGWVTSELPGGDHHVIKIEMKGPENTLRVRQVKVLGWKEGDTIKIAGQISASVVQQKNCEAETLRVFRLITSQVCKILFRYVMWLMYCQYNPHLSLYSYTVV